jgi:hypothetical protein
MVTALHGEGFGSRFYFQLCKSFQYFPLIGCLLHKKVMQFGHVYGERRNEIGIGWLES